MVGSELLLPDRESALVERFRLGVGAHGLKEPSQVVEGQGDVGMVGPELLLEDRQGALVKRLRLEIFALALEYGRLPVERSGLAPQIPLLSCSLVDGLPVVRC